MCPRPRAWGLCTHRPRSHSARGGTARTLGLLEAQTSARGRSRSEGQALGAARDLCATFPYKGYRPAHLGSGRCLRFEDGWGALRHPGGARRAAPPPGPNQGPGPRPLLWGGASCPGPGRGQRQTALCFPADSRARTGTAMRGPGPRCRGHTQTHGVGSSELVRAGRGRRGGSSLTGSLTRLGKAGGPGWAWPNQVCPRSGSETEMGRDCLCPLLPLKTAPHTL